MRGCRFGMVGREALIALAVALTLLAAGACARTQRKPAQASWDLMQPPQARDERYPRGFRVRSDAPLNEWSTEASFATREECEKSLHERLDDSIDRAREKYGDDAKNDLTVRRAVNARCVPSK